MMHIKKYLTITFTILMCSYSSAADIFVETESFTKKGGWVVDQQFMDIMGSSYMLAHGMGIPVEDASTIIKFPKIGQYSVFVRTFNWTSPWFKGEGPGKFQLSINDKILPKILGASGTNWEWQNAGDVRISTRKTKICLHDLTGFDGRCDAIYFSTEKTDIPPSNIKDLSAFRNKKLGVSSKPKRTEKFDLIVIGGGIAGICASVAAARLGLKVALIHDRPIIGGNNSSEVRVHLGGHIEMEPYKNLGKLINEFGQTLGGNAQPAAVYADDKKLRIITNEKNITLFNNFHAISVYKTDSEIRAITAQHIETGEKIKLIAKLFADCTGDGTIGYLAGANYLVGREAKKDYNEKGSPAMADKIVMGSSVQWNSLDTGRRTVFPIFNYGKKFNDESAEKVTMGEWTWETGMNLDQIADFEKIRDYGLLVVYSNWSFLKNELTNNDTYKNRSLEWVAYIAGKRESRRLLGDIILTKNDIEKRINYDDASVTTTWSIDLHYPDPQNSKYFPGTEFKSICQQEEIYPYPIPYRCFYSRNIDNLFMAGRDISVTHIALGTVRVMRTTGMMGEVVGMAASVCKKNGVNPRDVYKTYFNELIKLMKEGVGKKNTPKNQWGNSGNYKKTE